MSKPESELDHIYLELSHIAMGYNLLKKSIDAEKDKGNTSLTKEIKEKILLLTALLNNSAKRFVPEGLANKEQERLNQIKEMSETIRDLESKIGKGINPESISYYLSDLSKTIYKSSRNYGLNAFSDISSNENGAEVRLWGLSSYQDDLKYCDISDLENLRAENEEYLKAFNSTFPDSAKASGERGLALKFTSSNVKKVREITSEALGLTLAVKKAESKEFAERPDLLDSIIFEVDFNNIKLPSMSSHIDE